MLRERLITAAVLLLILAVLLSLKQSVYFATFCVIASGLTLAEWWRISLPERFKLPAYGLAAILTLVTIYFSFAMVTRGDEGAVATQFTDTGLIRLTLILSVISSFIWFFIVPLF